MDFSAPTSCSGKGSWEKFPDDVVKFAAPDSKCSRGPGSVRRTNVNDLPGAVLTSIFGMVSDPRSRNSMSLACKDWYYLERQTRTSLTLRGNLSYTDFAPVSFKNVTNLDLSCCSPWGYSIFQSEDVGRFLKEAFPNVKDLAIYVRDVMDIHMVVWLWPELETLRLVRWHPRATDVGSGLEMGSEVEPLLKCQTLRKLDLSAFYCWTEDIHPALESGSAVAANLLSLNLLKISPEGFKTEEIVAITAACNNLEELFVLCEFDPRFLDSVGDKALACIANNCPRLRVLHLVDNNEWGVRGNELHDGDGTEDANVTQQGLEFMFRNLPHLQDLVLLPAQNVWGSGPALEVLFTNCARLVSLHLSHFQGLCTGLDNDGMAKGANLTELSIKDCLDLSDQSLASIARGCRKLKKLSLKGCGEISEQGLRACVELLCSTLVDVEISYCSRLPSVELLRALEPIRNSIERLHMDCVWDDEVVARQSAAISTVRSSAKIGYFHPSSEHFFGNLGEDGCGTEAKASSSAGEMSLTTDEAPDEKCWTSLETLSLWIGVGLLISPLSSMGLGQCPVLKEVTIKVVGDCKSLKRPVVREWGLATLSRYRSFTKLNLDLGDVVSFSLSAPEGTVDLSIWERHYLSGVSDLQLRELDYKPPYDKDLTHRGLSLPAVGLLSQCQHIRKLIVHGSIHEHFLSMLHRNMSLRDFQLRWDFYPAPDYETTTEVRVESCKRFEAALAERGFSD